MLPSHAIKGLLALPPANNVVMVALEINAPKLRPIIVAIIGNIHTNSFQFSKINSSQSTSVQVDGLYQQKELQNTTLFFKVAKT